MNNCMIFPDSVEEFMEEYKMVDTEHVYSNGTEYVPIFRMKQWFEHLPHAEKTGKWMQTVNMNIFECSCCHSRWNIYYVCDFDYCPHCGVKMEMEE